MNGFNSEHETDSAETSGNLRFFAAMEQIKQQIARENIAFVRFEASDLHGVSRSKTVPVRFFHVGVLSSDVVAKQRRAFVLMPLTSLCLGVGESRVRDPDAQELPGADAEP